MDQQDNAKKEAEIETVVESLLEALKEDESPNTEQDKKKIITQSHHDDDIVDLEINHEHLISTDNCIALFIEKGRLYP